MFHNHAFNGINDDHTSGIFTAAMLVLFTIINKNVDREGDL